ncbi:MAG: hypothetical protein EBQ82_10940 [Betaproteobacteria bacterium]|nr:hypothetical protein [Betaproteobacteria bacterium]NBY05880.1 hypothetical protein [Betaproteobacteria bacterium]
MSSHAAQAYLRLVKVVLSLENHGPFKDLDQASIKLLEVIALGELEGSPLPVTKAMELKHIASPASIHRKLEALRSRGLIDHVYLEGNRRTKFLKPTELALDHYAQISQEMKLLAG